MNDSEYRSFLNLLMCSDPWPASAFDALSLEGLALSEALKRGYPDWIEAYHRHQINVCEICKGTGGVDNEPCSNCQGKGR
jgi:hypothetical protein